MIFEKNKYRYIPEEMKIWAGDDYLFYYMKGKKLGFTGVNITTQMSTSSGLVEFDDIKANDLKIWKQYMPFALKWKFFFASLRFSN